MSRPQYKCPRCSYKTPQKSNMRRHLYELKIICPACTLDIELTDEIKEYILLNRVWHQPKINVEAQEPTVIQIINQNNVHGNYVNNFNNFEKLKKNKDNITDLISLDKHTQAIFFPRASKLINNE